MFPFYYFASCSSRFASFRHLKQPSSSKRVVQSEKQSVFEETGKGLLCCSILELLWAVSGNIRGRVRRRAEGRNVTLS